MGGLKSFMKKIISIFLTAIMCLSVFTGCGNGCSIGLRLYENDIFIYTVGYDSGNVHILGLTEMGQQQNFLIIPNEIDGGKVIGLGADGYDKKKINEKYGKEIYASFNSEKLKKIFIEMKYLDYDTIDINFGSVPNLEGIYLVEKIEFNKKNGYAFLEEYSSRNIYTAEAIEFGRGKFTKKANVLYVYNYVNTYSDEYYWIDNYKYGEKIEYIPEQPLRDGYTFEGWYKEEECINRWNFATDSLPSEQLDNDGNVVYQETKLYAKWIKN